MPFSETGEDMSDKVLRPMRAIRRMCVDCAETAKMTLYCPADGVHSTRCPLWPYRMGMRPESVAKKYGRQFVTPELMPGADVSINELPMVGARLPKPADEVPGE